MVEVFRLDWSDREIEQGWRRQPNGQGWEVIVTQALRLDTKAGCWLAIRMIPFMERKGKAFKIRGSRRINNLQKIVVIDGVGGAGDEDG